MEKRIGYLWVFCVFIISCKAGPRIPEGFVLKVDKDCDYNTTTNRSARIVVTSDLYPEITAMCHSSNVGFTKLDLVTQQLLVSYGEPQNDGTCYFQRRHEVYSLQILISYGEPGSHLMQYQSAYLVTCSRSKHQLKESSFKQPAIPILAPKEIQGNEESVTNFVQVRLIDIIGMPITTSKIRTGRLVRLEAKSNGPMVQVVSCLAQSKSSGNKHYILSGGCGDGILFSTTEGFQTEGRTVRSPLFHFFGLGDSTDLHFQCTFVVCDDDCDGTSCIYSTERSKRSVQNDPQIENDVPIKSEGDFQITDKCCCGGADACLLSLVVFSVSVFLFLFIVFLIAKSIWRFRCCGY